MAEQHPERRLHRRVPIQVTVRMEYTGVEFQAATANLSAGGTFLLCDRRLPVGTRLRLRIDIPIITKYPIRAEGEVVRCDEEPRGLAIRFVEISDEDRALLGELAEKSESLLGAG